MESMNHSRQSQGIPTHSLTRKMSPFEENDGRRCRNPSSNYANM